MKQYERKPPCNHLKGLVTLMCKNKRQQNNLIISFGPVKKVKIRNSCFIDSIPLLTSAAEDNLDFFISSV